jgi:hypothetical protein
MQSDAILFLFSAITVGSKNTKMFQMQLSRVKFAVSGLVYEGN